MNAADMWSQLGYQKKLPAQVGSSESFRMSPCIVFAIEGLNELSKLFI